jgi:hypothetical protein
MMIPLGPLCAKSGNFGSPAPLNLLTWPCYRNTVGFHALYWLLCEAFHRPVIREAPLLQISRNQRSDERLSPVPKTGDRGPLCSQLRSGWRSLG